VAKGNFREDLFYRLNVVRITLPSLRERLDDIRPLVAHFIAKYSSERNAGSPVTGIDREVERLFYEYDWPGNVRELENVIERAVVLSPEEIIQVSDLPKDFIDNAHGTLHMDGIPVDANLYDTLALVEKNMIVRALKKANYIQAHAADLLGIGKSGLNQKIKKYRLVMKDKS
jgi:two-component system NtrC family response regulator